MGRLRHARYVQHRRNAGWPNGREPQGHGVSVVVRGGESPPHGEGRQVGRHLKGEGSEMDDDLNRVDVAALESCLTSKESRSVRRGAVGKVPAQVTRRPPTLRARAVLRGGGAGDSTSLPDYGKANGKTWYAFLPAIRTARGSLGHPN